MSQGQKDNLKFNAVLPAFKKCTENLRTTLIEVAQKGPNSKLYTYFDQLKELHNEFMGWVWDIGIFRLADLSCTSHRGSHVHGRPESWDRICTGAQNEIEELVGFTQRFLELSKQRVSPKSTSIILGNKAGLIPTWIKYLMPTFYADPEVAMKRAWDTLESLVKLSCKPMPNVYGPVRPLESILVHHHLERHVNLLRTEQESEVSASRRPRRWIQDEREMEKVVDEFREELWEDYFNRIKGILCQVGERVGDFGKVIVNRKDFRMVECTVCMKVFDEDDAASKSISLEAFLGALYIYREHIDQHLNTPKPEDQRPGEGAQAQTSVLSPTMNYPCIFVDCFEMIPG
ncbi:hypothetical protein BJ508DRAFT_358592, partial [Ascobolus immersus RN42]